jgi:hypothetical protein
MRLAHRSSTLYFIDFSTTVFSSLDSIKLVYQHPLERRSAATDKLAHHGSKHKRRSVRRKLTPLELLTQIKEYLPPQMPKIQFDYITLTKTCYIIHAHQDPSIGHPEDSRYRASSLSDGRFDSAFLPADGTGDLERSQGCAKCDAIAARSASSKSADGGYGKGFEGVS